MDVVEGDDGKMEPTGTLGTKRMMGRTEGTRPTMGQRDNGDNMGQGDDGDGGGGGDDGNNG